MDLHARLWLIATSGKLAAQQPHAAQREAGRTIRSISNHLSRDQVSRLSI